MDFVYVASFQSPSTIGRPFTEYGRENIFSSVLFPHIFVREGGCMCVPDSWKNGESWKSSAAVSLLLTAHVHVSEGAMYGENERGV